MIKIVITRAILNNEILGCFDGNVNCDDLFAQIGDTGEAVGFDEPDESNLSALVRFDPERSGDAYWIPSNSFRITYVSPAPL